MPKKKQKVYTKICTVCKEEKFLDEFYKKADQPDGLYPNCKDCENKKQLASRMKKRNAGRKARIERKDEFDWKRDGEKLKAAREAFTRLFWNTNESVVTTNDWLANNAIELKALRQDIKEMKNK